MNQPAILYTQTTCPDSANVVEWLESRGIRFTERNVTEDQSAMNEFAAQRLFVTPLLIVGDVRVIGFQSQKLAELFGDNVSES